MAASKTLVRFVVLTLDDVWSDWEPPMVRGADRSKTVKHGRRNLKPDKHNVKSAVTSPVADQRGVSWTETPH